MLLLLLLVSYHSPMNVVTPHLEPKHHPGSANRRIPVSSIVPSSLDDAKDFPTAVSSCAAVVETRSVRNLQLFPV